MHSTPSQCTCNRTNEQTNDIELNKMNAGNEKKKGEGEYAPVELSLFDGSYIALSSYHHFNIPSEPAISRVKK